MAKAPPLTNYPHLHSVLRQDSVANAQFQSYVSAVRGRVSNADTSEAALQASEENLAKLLTRFENLRNTYATQQRLVTLLGEVIEPQCHLTPYTQDIADNVKYEITFTADQIRKALGLHWDLIAQNVENTIAGKAPITDSVEP